MRIWSLHPKYLDAKGLVALWRETLLAQNVLLGKTKGYKNHPQLDRFKQHKDPVAAIGNYLSAVVKEAERREYNFNSSKIYNIGNCLKKIPVTQGQIEYEWEHLLSKLKKRDNEKWQEIKKEKNILPHPLFTTIPGEIENWEKL